MGWVAAQKVTFGVTLALTMLLLWQVGSWATCPVYPACPPDLPGLYNKSFLQLLMLRHGIRQ